MKVLVAGATGALGKQLVPKLVADGHEVAGTTRQARGGTAVEALGATPVVVDALDPDAVAAAVAAAEPDVIVHELTALSGSLDLRHFERDFAPTNRLRTEAHRPSARRRPCRGRAPVRGAELRGLAVRPRRRAVKTEEDPLDPAPAEPMRASARRDSPPRGGRDRRGLDRGRGASLRRLLRARHVASTRSGEHLEAIRKRQVPGGRRRRGRWSFVHIEDAAEATLIAVERGERGIYNIVDDEPAPVSEWLPAAAAALGAKPPRHVPRVVGRRACRRGGHGHDDRDPRRLEREGEARARLEPQHPSWRQGFAEVAA